MESSGNSSASRKNKAKLTPAERRDLIAASFARQQENIHKAEAEMAAASNSSSAGNKATAKLIKAEIDKQIAGSFTWQDAPINAAQAETVATPNTQNITSAPSQALLEADRRTSNSNSEDLDAYLNRVIAQIDRIKASQAHGKANQHAEQPAPEAKKEADEWGHNWE